MNTVSTHSCVTTVCRFNRCLQVPTFRADPLTPACDSWCDFPVSDRPNAVRQFFDAAVRQPSLIQVSEAQCSLSISTKYEYLSYINQTINNKKTVFIVWTVLCSM